ncbi:hypothetical protein ACJZ2D_003351 [Fusarium nematophilum]
MPIDPGQQILDDESHRRNLRSKVANLPVSIEEYNRRAEAIAELISRNEQEIYRLQAQVDEIRAAEEAKAQAEAQADWNPEQGGLGCLELYGSIKTVQSKDADLLYVSAKLDFEQKRSAVLEREVGRVAASMNHQTAPRSSSYRLIDNLLKSKENTLRELTSLTARHCETGAGRDLVWPVHDKARLRELIERLKELNDDLTTLLSQPAQVGMDFHLMAEALAPSDPETLRRVHEKMGSQHQAIATAARVKALRMEMLRGSVAHRPLHTLDPSGYRLCAPRMIQWPRLGPRGTPSNALRGLEDALQEERAFGILPAASGDAVMGGAGLPSTPTPVLVEWRSTFRSQTAVTAFAHRLDTLVYTLRQMDEAGRTTSAISDSPPPGGHVSFGILRCMGWLASDSEFTKIGLVYELPRSVEEAPVSLYDMIRNTRREKSDIVPSLGDRFSMARSIARSLANFMMVKWMHKGFRSNNVILLNEARPTEVLLVGFSYARPGDAVRRDLTTPLSSDPTYDLYRPPADTLPPDRLREAIDASEEILSSSNDGERPVLSPAYDVFGLGIVLLEIGLWRTIDSIRGNTRRDPAKGRKNLDSAVDSLRYRCGTIYRDVVRACLNLPQGPDQDSGVLVHMEDILVQLARCNA